MPIREGHPRLLITAPRLAALQASPLAAKLRAMADGMLGELPAERVLQGGNMLSVSRLVLERCSVLGLAHQLWGGPYAARVRSEIAAVAAFSDWNPEHFLDAAELAAAVALGLDWCWEALAPADRRLAVDAIERHAFRPALAGRHWWLRGHNNWNQVCHGGLALAALAVQPACGELAGRILTQAREGIASGLEAYAPEGVYPEGPTYWEYGTTYSALLADALATAAGEDWGVLRAPGFLDSVRFVRACTAPSGVPFCYGDTHHVRMLLAPAVWMAARLDDPGTVAWARRHLLAPEARERFQAFAALWACDGEGDDGAPAPTAWRGRGAAQVASLRSAWDERAMWVGFKAGSLRVSHGHMDAGSFELEADGVRWLSDLGAESEIYRRGDSWDTAQDSPRWRYLRAANTGHNLVIVGERRQNVEGANPLRLAGQAVIADLSAAYADCAGSAARGIALLGADAVLIQDEFTGLVAEPLLWQAFTGAQVVCDGPEALLTQGGRSLRLRVLQPAEAVFAVRSAAPPTAAENQNEGFRRLVIAIPPRAGDRRIRVLLSRAEVPEPPPRPLSAW